jgi:hypothetical protein
MSDWVHKPSLLFKTRRKGRLVPWESQIPSESLSNNLENNYIRNFSFENIVILVVTQPTVSLEISQKNHFQNDCSFHLKFEDEVLWGWITRNNLKVMTKSNL